MSISANGSAVGSGIVWASHPYNEDANQKVVDGILRAYDASDLTNELWNSKQNPNRDDLGKYAKFCLPRLPTARYTWLRSRTRLWSTVFCPQPATKCRGDPCGRPVGSRKAQLFYHPWR
jgi:hypothetical protein